MESPATGGRGLLGPKSSVQPVIVSVEVDSVPMASSRRNERRESLHVASMTI
jgi:hypothetical protein